MKLLARELAIALLTLPGVALAQPATEACPAADPQMAKDFAPFTDAMLEPGKAMDIAAMTKNMSPDTRTKLGLWQKRAEEQRAKDFANLCRYAEENAAVKASGVRPRVVFVGDSITENWKKGDPAMFGPTVLDRGIGGQTTPQIMLRFYQDVVAMRPRAVHIMAGVNDIMGNTGPATDEAIVNNIRAMIDVAKANRIRVVLASITPAKQFAGRPNLDLAPRIAAVNQMLVALAAQMRVTHVDYAPVLADAEGGFKVALANDGLHPNRDGYAAMRPLAEQVIARAAR
jgi:lysophospholipase L1-like esterase